MEWPGRATGTNTCLFAQAIMGCKSAAAIDMLDFLLHYDLVFFCVDCCIPPWNQLMKSRLGICQKHYEHKIFWAKTLPIPCNCPTENICLTMSF
ncbi:Hypothetical predicted protein [Podarcis lilfordi]|uniref:Uncharacterized protein n=1 Tax=Podarcis lilfordi TaxID=74358 RepID=A0AA35JW95_9SAUR|nr:Hypothetical predicted protein [Podarcis lilfordi]